MKTVIAGSRSITNYKCLLEAVAQIDWEITEVISGNARGVDRLGERWARENNIPVRLFFPDWNKWGKRAGFVRNQEMIEEADALLALWDGESRGTKHTMNLAQGSGMPNKVFIFSPD